MKTQTKLQRKEIYELALHKVGGNNERSFRDDRLHCICRALFLISGAGKNNHKPMYRYFRELALFSCTENIEDCYNVFWFETKEERQTALLFMIEMCKK